MVLPDLQIHLSQGQLVCVDNIVWQLEHELCRPCHSRMLPSYNFGPVLSGSSADLWKISTFPGLPAVKKSHLILYMLIGRERLKITGTEHAKYEQERNSNCKFSNSLSLSVSVSPESVIARLPVQATFQAQWPIYQNPSLSVHCLLSGEPFYHNFKNVLR